MVLVNCDGCFTFLHNFYADAGKSMTIETSRFAVTQKEQQVTFDTGSFREGFGSFLIVNEFIVNEFI